MWGLLGEEERKQWREKAVEVRMSQEGRWLVALDMRLKRATNLSDTEREMLFDLRELATIEIWVMCKQLIDDFYFA